MRQEFVRTLLEIQTQVKILHWQTFSEARHVAYGQIYNDLGETIDEFVEIMMGKYGRFEFPEEGAEIKLFNLKSIEINSFLGKSEEFFITLTDKLDGRRDTDLLNLRDEMLGMLNKLRYLLTQK